jgi:hypothetical protein
MSRSPWWKYTMIGSGYEGNSRRIMKSWITGRLYLFAILAISVKKMGKPIALNARVWGPIEDN